MGKIRVKTLGVEETEEKQKEEAKHRREHKKTAKAPGMKGGERVVSVGPTEEELASLEASEAQKLQEKPATTEKPKERKAQEKHYRSQKYQAMAQTVDSTRNYGLTEALELLEKLQRGKFDETVELHINTLTPGISGNVTLPHGTGKKTRVAVADPSASSGQLNELLKEIEAGQIDFDILIATPQAMPLLARVAKVLGPRGLMPNPKNGTITQNPQDLVKKYEGGQINFKTEAKTPIIHLTVGKISFGKEKLSQNIETLISAIKKQNIVNATLKSTMSPGIKISV